MPLGQLVISRLQKDRTYAANAFAKNGPIRFAAEKNLADLGDDNSSEELSQTHFG